MADFSPLHNSPYFDVREFVDRRTWQALGPKAASLIYPPLVRVSDRLRELSGAPITVNNWHFRKPGQPLYDSSGFRAVWDKTGGNLSQHRRGFAADFKSRVYTPAQLLSIIMDNAAEFLELGLTTVEDLQFTPGWLHCDCRVLIGEWADLAEPFLIVRP